MDMTEVRAASIIAALVGVKTRQPKPPHTKTLASGEEITTERHVSTRKRKTIKGSS